VLKVGHHGSNTSSTDPFLDAVTAESPRSPTVSRTHYITPQVLKRLAAHHAAVYRTDEQGLIRIRTDGRRLVVETFRSDLRWPPAFDLASAER
jgi:competence protein ComEC